MCLISIAKIGKRFRMLEIYILSYNNIFCVDYQIKCFKSFCLDDHNLIVIDSNCGEFPHDSQSKKEICNTYGVEFLSLPAHLSLKNLNPTNILGEKLNFVYKQIIKERNPEYFAFIDQDFFPFKKFRILPTLNQLGMYGDVCEEENCKSPSDLMESVIEGPWVLHPWLSFYKTDFFDGLNPDWNPCSGFDTGGKNWENVIKKKKLNKKDYWLRHKTLMYFPFDEISDSGPEKFKNHFFLWNGENVYSQIQIYDGKFVHMLNSKYLDDPRNPKTNWCKGFLDSCILASGSLEFSNLNGFHNEGPSFKI